jgi:hypothetical protein
MASSLMQVESLYSGISATIKDTAVRAGFVYPRTDSIKDDIPEETFQMKNPDSPNYQELITYCQQSISLKALDGLEDILEIVDSLTRIHTQMLFNRVDCIQIWKGGIDLLRINMEGQKTGRSAYIEINSLRLRLMNLLHKKEYDAASAIFKNNISLSIIIGFATVAASIWFGLSRRG